MPELVEDRRRRCCTGWAIGHGAVIARRISGPAATMVRPGRDDAVSSWRNGSGSNQRRETGPAPHAVQPAALALRLLRPPGRRSGRDRLCHHLDTPRCCCCCCRSTESTNMGGGDLNLKKSWHPGTLRFQEKVWKKEKQAEDERKKMEQLQKELQEERAMAELQALQEAAGKVKPRMGRMDWMYGGGPGGSSAIAEEKESYLLGKKRIDSLIEQGKTTEELSASNVFSASAAGVYGATANTSRDVQTKIREDPLLAIKKREQDALQSVLSNPLKVKQLRREREEREGKDRSDKKDRKEKKERKHKKEKKSHHKDSRRSDDHDDGSNDRDRSSGHGSRKHRRADSESSDSDSDSSDHRQGKRSRPEPQREASPSARLPRRTPAGPDDFVHSSRAILPRTGDRNDRGQDRDSRSSQDYDRDRRRRSPARSRDRSQSRERDQTDRRRRSIDDSSRRSEGQDPS
ncbi:Pre-mRNA splicing factor-domain-containing protein [Polychytrium aggregatum]|uniref:Pre-mRNA splicing factor-domain-containing protein n=1 Tax=Polychytrium aggregatum TaxID=110093 RepID=UPI0022FE07CC|nr:Pre-mRNA splicing factor-domain-containing protein [Polychytrium aggregatum]KAI9202302.1 Pre-mRNA splicing factor-domain-containing protein [Polychytrium aggregatum]